MPDCYEATSPENRSRNLVRGDRFTKSRKSNVMLRPLSSESSSSFLRHQLCLARCLPRAPPARGNPSGGPAVETQLALVVRTPELDPPCQRNSRAA